MDDFKPKTDTIGPFFVVRHASAVADAAIKDCAVDVRILRGGPPPYVYHVQFETTPFFLGRGVDALLWRGLR